MKIVFIGFLHGYGGAERSIISVANGLVNLGHEVSLISLKSNNVVYKLDKKVNYIYIPDRESLNFYTKLKRFWDLTKVLKKLKPDLVISFWLQPAVYSAILSKFIGFKTIYSERGDPSDKEYSGKLGLLRNIFFNFMDGFVFQSKSAKEFFSENIQKKGIVIHNAVNLKMQDYIIPKKRRKVIVNVGRLHEQKNQRLLIKAFKKISEEFKDYKLEIFGDGDLKNELLELIKELNLEKKVLLKGTTNNLFNEIKDASLFVLSSNYEGMPNALMEAMALGIPCITTDFSPGGARELIVNKHNGLLVKRNSINELVCAIRYMLHNYEEAQKMGKNAMEISNTHSIENIIKKWENYVLRFYK